MCLISQKTELNTSAYVRCDWYLCVMCPEPSHPGVGQCGIAVPSAPFVPASAVPADGAPVAVGGDVLELSSFAS